MWSAFDHWPLAVDQLPHIFFVSSIWAYTGRFFGNEYALSRRGRSGAERGWGPCGCPPCLWRVGPSPRGRPQGPTPHIRATPAPTRGGVSTPQKPTPESHLRLPSLTGYRPQHLHYALLTVDPHPIAGV